MKKIFIYGAGTAGKQLFDLIQKDKNVYEIIAWIDDDISKQGIKINGLKVLSFKKFKSDIKDIKYSDIEVFIAIPSSSQTKRQAKTESIRNLGIQVRCLPGVEYILDGQVSITEINLTNLSGVLNRQEISLMTSSDRELLNKKNILVAGGGGSIGSELSRQIHSCNPEKLVILDHSEFNLYALLEHFERESNSVPDNIIVILGSINDSELVNTVIKNNAIDIIFHAAAYKHVPLVEKNIAVSVKNNIFGTKILCESAMKNSVKSFTLISTDKAVRPTNVMGATKRVCELLLQAYSMNTNKTKFSMVRFGNVLNSSGSVVPKFLNQVREGGPLTVTHPEIMRYFMTIEEAASLVLKSSMIAIGGEIFLLDMGDEISIHELAKRIIQLSGKSNILGDDDYIEIRFTGLRPGEKLREELIIDGDLKRTSVNKIFSTKEKCLPLKELNLVLEDLMEATNIADEITIKKLLSAMVEDYR